MLRTVPGNVTFECMPTPLQSRALRFLVLFVGLYLVGYLSYDLYLQQHSTHQDPATELVAQRGLSFANTISSNTFTATWTDADGMYVSTAGNENFVRIVEGCNGLAVVILFIAFVIGIAFKPLSWFTLRFALFGSLFLYGINLARVALLIVWMNRFPEYTDLLHDIIFPGIIYGSVILLWLVWIKIDTRRG